MAGETQPGGKVEQVLTDTEILNAFGRWDGFYATLEAVRKVEAAVLAKQKTSLGGLYGAVQRAFERKRAVTAQRDAYRKGFLKAWEDARACVREKAAYGSMAWDRDRQVPIMDTEFFNTEPEYIYPDLPTKRVPRTVVLSDGRRVSSDDDGWAYSPYSHAKTPADARLLADLVERPYDEVQDVG